MKEAVERQFSAAAAGYSVSGVHAGGPDLEAMLEVAELRGNERVLDLGCGTGHTTLAFAARALRVDGIDLSRGMLDQARRLASERGVDNCHWHLGDVEDLPFPDASFAVVTSRQSAHHYVSTERALAETARVLAPGGRFVLVDSVAAEDPAADTFLNAFELLRDPSHVRDHRVSEWCRLFAAAGLSATPGPRWWLDMDFDGWVSRSQTAPDAVDALRALVRHAPRAVAEPYFPDAPHCTRVRVEAGLVVGEKLAP
ncbi:MAG: class I SAM-dependent methyltransferase [Proteobacteria bacterium]|nr:class I SAM-dependent methyltransferase [Pseudomonadota bacterium]